MSQVPKICLKNLNDVLICHLCNGYLIDATTLTECNHVFCRGCILRYLETNKAACPSCNTVCKKKNQAFFKPDLQLQSIVYKVVPGLYSKEIQRKEDFYRSTGVRASSSCSDDSVFERERDMINDEDTLVASYVGDKTQFFGPEDSISLSLEFYQQRLDTISTQSEKEVNTANSADKSAEVNKSEKVVNNNNSDEGCDSKHKLNGTKDNESETKDIKSEKRFLQCPAAVSMKHLQKFVRMKYALSPNHKVDIIYRGEVLPLHFSLMDVAYTFKWTRLKPMRFFYRIFVPSKIQPIKIINKTLSTGGKQLQVVPAIKSPKEPVKIISNEVVKPQIKVEEEDKERSVEKERLLANLQLQCKSKVQNVESVPEKVQDCVFNYDENDKEEIKKFAEIRDREWALQKKMDESTEVDYHHFSKKRKKNKHSKNDSAYKKRKLHAEITNKEEELKLKVKLTPHNGHKHKHHKIESGKKEKLLEMRQVRHKPNISSEDKNVQTVPSSDKKDEQKVETIEDKKSNGVPNKPTKEWGNKVPTVQIERNEQMEQQAKKNLIKSYQAYAEKYQQSMVLSRVNPTPFERKIANLQQQCTIEAKPPQKPENKEKKLPQYSAGFTVSKIETGVKRKIEVEERVDKRPSLEITLINPSVESTKITTPAGTKIVTPAGTKVVTPAGTKVVTPAGSKVVAPTGTKVVTQTGTKVITPTGTKVVTSLGPKVVTPAKRPPPPTIPLDRIKKSFCLKSGISIIPKLPEKCDNIGALDLSARPQKDGDTSKVNGFISTDSKPVNMTNLQMLSKVASEHPTLNKNLQKQKPQLPNLHTIKIPSLNQRIPPNLEKLNRNHQFRLSSPQIRNLRPNQNQSIRNIPNPSLLIRQQNQNRLNSLNPVKEKEVELSKVEEAKTVEKKDVV